MSCRPNANDGAFVKGGLFYVMKLSMDTGKYICCFLGDKFNDWGGGGDVTYLPPFGRGRHENSPYRGHIDQPPGQMR